MHEVNDRSRDIGEFVPAPDDDMLICRCEEITKGEIRKAVHDGMWTMISRDISQDSVQAVCL